MQSLFVISLPCLFIFPLLACLVSSVGLLVLVLPRFVVVCYLLVLFISLCCCCCVVVHYYLFGGQFDASFV